MGEGFLKQAKNQKQHSVYVFDENITLGRDIKSIFLHNTSSLKLYIKAGITKQMRGRKLESEPFSFRHRFVN